LRTDPLTGGEGVDTTEADPTMSDSPAPPGDRAPRHDPLLRDRRLTDDPAPQDRGFVVGPQDWRFSASNVGRLSDVQMGRTNWTTNWDGTYVGDVQIGVAAARSRYRRLMWFVWALRIMVITASAVITVLAAAGGADWILATLGAVATVAQGVVIATNLQKRALTCGMLADAMARELRLYFQNAGPYKEDHSMAALAERVEALRQKASAELFSTAGDEAGGAGTTRRNE
jgi:hypothetical protein